MSEHQTETSTSHSDHQTSSLTVSQILFSLDGRIPRSTYWFASLGSVFVFAIIGFIVAAFLSRTDIDEATVQFLGLLLALPLLWVQIAISVKRFHDRNKSGWWYLISLIPYLGALWLLIENGFLAGDEGLNQYGLPLSRSQ